MRTELVVVPSPALYFVFCVLWRHKPVHVQAFVPEAVVEGFDMRIDCRRTGPGTIELDRSIFRSPGNADVLAGGVWRLAFRQISGQFCQHVRRHKLVQAEIRFLSLSFSLLLGGLLFRRAG